MLAHLVTGMMQRVSPITIRLRILKASHVAICVGGALRFTHHDPLEDTESVYFSYLCISLFR